jgi:hypothetical protein
MLVNSPLQYPSPLGYSIRKLFKEAYMERKVRNKPSKKVNETLIGPTVIADVAEQARVPVKPLNTQDAVTMVAQGTAALVQAAQYYDQLARSLRDTVNTLDRIHQ